MGASFSACRGKSGKKRKGAQPKRANSHKKTTNFCFPNSNSKMKNGGSNGNKTKKKTGASVKLPQKPAKKSGTSVKSVKEPAKKKPSAPTKATPTPRKLPPARNNVPPTKSSKDGKIKQKRNEQSVIETTNDFKSAQRVKKPTRRAPPAPPKGVDNSKKPRVKQNVQINVSIQNEQAEHEQIPVNGEDDRQDNILNLKEHFQDFDVNRLEVPKNSLEFIQEIKKRAKTFEMKVANFSGTNYSIEYFVIDENLMQLLEALDKVIAQKDKYLLQEKVKVITYINTLHSQLDSQVVSD